MIAAVSLFLAFDQAFTLMREATVRIQASVNSPGGGN
jgi:hypothetical protein